MPQLIVRRIESEVVEKLRQKAAKEGISMEEEHRRILRTSLLGRGSRQKMDFKEYLRSMPNVGKDSDFVMPRDYPRKVRL
jgi:plasmid stability protein